MGAKELLRAKDEGAKELFRDAKEELLRDGA